MNAEINKEQVKHYQENGFLLIRQFLDETELKYWRDAVGEAVEKRSSRKLPDRELVSHGDDEAYYEKVFTQRLQLWKDNEKIRKIMLDERIGKIACELAGVSGIRIWHDQALIKPPWGEPTAWHLDVPFWSFSSKAAISIWVALDDVDLQNGCMYFMPGTHMETTYENPGITSDIGSIFNHYPQFRGREVVPAIMKAGDASFHNASLVHGAGPNMTPRPRRAMTCAYMPDGSKFNGQKNILSDEEFAALKAGDLLNDDSKNPLLFKVG